MARGKNTDAPPVLWDVKASRKTRFEALVEGYSSDLYRYAFWLCRSREQAEDLVQETYTRVWRSLDNLRDPQAAKSWLFTILRREHARQFERYQPELAELDPNEVGARGDQGYDHSTEAFALRRALDALAQEYREPLVLQVLGGFSCEEIAAQMGLSRGAVMTRLFRARRQLRAMLEGDDEGFEEADS
jgi:RNA polymerase sigma-70 factor (ECF subfamily)